MFSGLRHSPNVPSAWGQVDNDKKKMFWVKLSSSKRTTLFASKYTENTKSKGEKRSVTAGRRELI